VLRSGVQEKESRNGRSAIGGQKKEKGRSRCCSRASDREEKKRAASAVLARERKGKNGGEKLRAREGKKGGRPPVIGRKENLPLQGICSYIGKKKKRPSGSLPGERCSHIGQREGKGGAKEGRKSDLERRARGKEPLVHHA